ncbi:S-adenosyl-L-methionine-dependent methyltransferase [Phytophthora cactorum]|nr:S-adenosyl-L-methionine-dependent methyltransferase [Phytophthora cactorum]
MAEEEALTESEPLALESSFTHWARCVEVPIGDDRVVSVEQDPDSFVLGTTVWDSSKTLLKFMSNDPSGSSASRPSASSCNYYWRTGRCGAYGHWAVLPWLRRNVRENLTDKELQRVRVLMMFYGLSIIGAARDESPAPFDCILCADVVYEKACVKPLVQSLLALSHRKTVIFLANERRAPEVRAEFMKHLDSYFQWKEVPKTELDADYLKGSIEVFEMKPKKRKVPLEMQIVTPENFNPDEQEYHPLGSGVGNEADPYDRDLWNDLLRDLSLDPTDKKKPS